MFLFCDAFSNMLELWYLLYIDIFIVVFHQKQNLENVGNSFLI